MVEEALETKCRISGNPVATNKNPLYVSLLNSRLSSQLMEILSHTTKIP
jgi:hypothetical protein